MPTDIVGCILAGGQSRRMGGGDKALRLLQNRSMLDLVVERMRPQVRHLVLNANGDPARFSDYNLAIVQDDIDGFAGPLAGVSAGLNWARQNVPTCTHIATAAADTPFFPHNLVDQFISGKPLNANTIVMASSQGNRHPVFALWPIDLADDLSHWLQHTDTYKVVAWARNHELKMVDFPMIETPQEIFDPFFNANTPEDLVVAQRLVDQIGV